MLLNVFSRKSPEEPDRNIAVEDFRDAFGVTHEAAALRFTNLATAHLDLEVHFLRVGDDGAVYKAYENDGLRLPVDVTGSTEGQIVCRKSTLSSFAHAGRRSSSRIGTREDSSACCGPVFVTASALLGISIFGRYAIR